MKLPKKWWGYIPDKKSPTGALYIELTDIEHTLVPNWYLIPAEKLEALAELVKTARIEGGYPIGKRQSEWEDTIEAVMVAIEQLGEGE